MEQRLNARAGETGDPRENPLTSGIVRHDSHMPKSGSNPGGNRTWFALVGCLESVEAAPKRKGEEKREIPEKTHRPVALSGTIPTCENPGIAQPGIEPGSP
ncbi:hypothetical protein PR048_032186 [Dryococelus australis]|uniref:Prolactin receptor n=1 Tax=Dryococelus australis TaxID=614101 RepID=A0ABQ9G2D2_9NEOP|nr:hypothetical protein PR048_032186 [Dryococelus australis]